MKIVKVNEKLGMILIESENKIWHNNLQMPQGIYRTTNMVLLEDGKLKACFDTDLKVIDEIDDKILQ